MVATHQTEVKECGRGWEAKMDSVLGEAEQLHKTKMAELEQQYMAKLESVRERRGWFRSRRRERPLRVNTRRDCTRFLKRTKLVSRHFTQCKLMKYAEDIK